MVFVEGWFVVEGIDVRRTAVQEQVNHPFGLGGEVRLLGRQRRVEAAGRRLLTSPSRIPSLNLPVQLHPFPCHRGRASPGGSGKRFFSSWLVTRIGLSIEAGNSVGAGS